SADGWACPVAERVRICAAISISITARTVKFRKTGALSIFLTGSKNRDWIFLNALSAFAIRKIKCQFLPHYISHCSKKHTIIQIVCFLPFYHRPAEDGKRYE